MSYDKYILWKYNKAEKEATWNKYHDIAKTLRRYRSEERIEKEEPQKNNPYYRQFEKKK